MIRVFQGSSASEVWLKAYTEIQSSPTFENQIGRGGATHELIHAVLCIENPRQRWVLSRIPGINPAFAIAEVIWIMCGRQDAMFLTNWNSRLPQYVGHDKNRHGAYGFRLRQHFGLDQLERAYNVLRNNPTSRQVVLQIWDPIADLPSVDGAPQNPDIPCNLLSVVKIREGKLEWLQILRSNDLLLGAPYNLVQFTFLQEILAGWLGLELGSYNQVSDSLHIYHHDTQRFKSEVINDPINSDLMNHPKDETEVYFAQLAECAEKMVQTTSFQELDHLREHTPVPVSYKNLLYVLAAEVVRRKKWLDAEGDFMVRCSNPMLEQAWRRWLQRFPDIEPRTSPA